MWSRAFWNRRRPQGRSIEARHDPYFVQKVQVGTECMNRTRVELFSRICAGRKVLHVGCADWPITDPDANLHVQLDPVCAGLDGFDARPESFDLLRPRVRGSLFHRWEDVTGAYDLVLAPEVLEHVGDVRSFLEQLNGVDAKHVVLTVPDAYQCSLRHFEYLEDAGTFVEIVHPDHNCWYTPYTLSNVIAKYTPWEVEGIWFFNRISLLAVMRRDRGCPGLMSNVL